MKKLLILSLSLLVLFACKKGDNPLDIIPGVPEGGAGNLPTVVSIVPANGAQINDYSNQSGIQGRIEIVFSDYMDEATLGGITITNTTTNSTISGITTEYYPEIKKLFVYVADLAGNSAYSIRLNGFENTYGSPLDFDGDNHADGAPYDDYLSAFYTAGNTDTLISTVQSKITGLDPYLELTNDTLQVITITFSISMDTFDLRDLSNYKLENQSTGTTYPLSRVAITPTAVMVQPSSNLPIGANYTFTIACANLNRWAKSVTPAYIFPLDGNANGPEAAEPDTGGYFRVDTVIPPTVNVSSIGGGALFTFSKKMDETLIDLTTVKVFDNIGYVPGELRIYSNYGDTQTLVEYYYKRATSGAPDAFASKDLKQNDKDYYLDGDGNGIGGEQWDDYWEYNF
jgi:hypothetical protein